VIEAAVEQVDGKIQLDLGRQLTVLLTRSEALLGRLDTRREDALKQLSGQAGLTLPYYGAEDFALHAIAHQVSSGATLDLLGLVEAIRFGAVAATTFAVGLILLGVGGVLAAMSIWRTAILPRFSGVPLAIGLVLLIPQFYLPGWARIAHGVLVAIGLVWLAVALWTSRPDGTRQFRSTPEERDVDTTPFRCEQARVGRNG
jgi:hypothetical protein